MPEDKPSRKQDTNAAAQTPDAEQIEGRGGATPQHVEAATRLSQEATAPPLTLYREQGRQRTDGPVGAVPRHVDAATRLSEETFAVPPTRNTERVRERAAYMRTDLSTAERATGFLQASAADSFTAVYPRGFQGHGLKPGNLPKFEVDSGEVVSFTTTEGKYVRISRDQSSSEIYNTWRNVDQPSSRVEAFVSQKDGTLSITYKRGGVQEIYTPQGTVIHRRPDGTAVERINSEDGPVVRTRDSEGCEHRHVYDPRTGQLSREEIPAKGVSQAVPKLADGRPQWTIDKVSGATIVETPHGSHYYRNLDGSITNRPGIPKQMPANVEYGPDGRPAMVRWEDEFPFRSKYDASGHLESFTLYGKYNYDKDSNTYKSEGGNEHEYADARQTYDGTVILTSKDGTTKTYSPDGHISVIESDGRIGEPRRLSAAGELRAGRPMDGNSPRMVEKESDGSCAFVVDHPSTDGSPARSYVNSVVRGDKSTIDFGYSTLKTQFGKIQSMKITQNGHVDEYYNFGGDFWVHMKDGESSAAVSSPMLNTRRMAINVSPHDGTVTIFQRTGGTEQNPEYQKGQILRTDGTRTEFSKLGRRTKFVDYDVNDTVASERIVAEEPPKPEVRIPVDRAVQPAVAETLQSSVAELGKPHGKAAANAEPVVNASPGTGDMIVRDGRRSGARAESTSETAAVQLASGTADLRGTESGGYEIATATAPPGKIVESELRSPDEIRAELIERMRSELKEASGLSPDVREAALKMCRLAENPYNTMAREALFEVHTKHRIGKGGAAVIGVGAVGLALAAWYAAYKVTHSQEAYIPPATVK